MLSVNLYRWGTVIRMGKNARCIRNTDIDEEELSNAVRSTLDGKPRMSFEESR